MWLEDVSESTDAQWTLEQYAIAARHLGQMNGSFLTDRALPFTTVAASRVREKGHGS